MGTYANFLIEVKDTSDSKWRLLDGYYPFLQKEESYYENEQWVKKVSEPDLVCTSGEKLTKANRLWRQGSIRDIFSDSYFNDTHLNHRGLPVDISEGAKAIFDEKMAKIEKEQQEYREKYGMEKPFGGKWWWGESYATMAELEKLFESELEKWKANLKKQIEKKFKDEILYKKSDEIFNLLNDVLVKVGGDKKKEKKVKIDKDEIGAADETIDYLLEEDIWDIFNIHSFVQTVNEICDLLTNDYYEARVIVWLD